MPVFLLCFLVEECWRLGVWLSLEVFSGCDWAMVHSDYVSDAVIGVWLWTISSNLFRLDSVRAALTPVLLLTVTVSCVSLPLLCLILSLPASSHTVTEGQFSSKEHSRCVSVLNPGLYGCTDMWSACRFYTANMVTVRSNLLFMKSDRTLHCPVVALSDQLWWMTTDQTMAMGLLYSQALSMSPCVSEFTV